MKRAATTAVAAALAVLGTGACTGAGGNPPASTLTATASSAQPASACATMPTTGFSGQVIDWVDFVQLGGIQYVSDLEGVARTVPADQLGPVVGRVTCRLSSLSYVGPPRPPVDGDAGFISVGTPVRSVKGWPPSCRVAALVEGANHLYVAMDDPGKPPRSVSCPADLSTSPTTAAPTPSD